MVVSDSDSDYFTFPGDRCLSSGSDVPRLPGQGSSPLPTLCLLDPETCLGVKGTATSVGPPGFTVCQ